MRSKSILLLILLATTNLCKAIKYEIIDLGTLGGATSWALGINNQGQVVGTSDTIDYPHGFVYENGTMYDLGTLYGEHSSAYSINELGQIVGYTTYPSEYTSYAHAIFYENGVMTDLGTLGGKRSFSRGINNMGRVVGYSNNHIGYERAYLYDGGQMEDLGTLGGVLSRAYGINDLGQIVGYSKIDEYNYHAFLYKNRRMTDLGTLGGAWSFAFDINNNGQIVGYSNNHIGYERAYLYDGGQMKDLGTLGGTGSKAYGINDLGQVVGRSYYGAGRANHAFLYDNGVMYDLNTLINEPNWILSSARDINNYGQIVGSGYINGREHAFLLNPLPELVLVVDIKPTSCPNPLNVKSRGVLPVAILGSEDFDVNSIDIASIRLAGVAPIRSSYEDVATPVSDANECECSTEGPDGFPDLALKFETQKIVEAIGEVNNGDELTLELTGVLSDETSIEGSDCIIICGNHKPLNRADFNGDGIVDMEDFAAFSENWLQSSIVEY